MAAACDVDNYVCSYYVTVLTCRITSHVHPFVFLSHMKRKNQDKCEHSPEME